MNEFENRWVQPNLDSMIATELGALLKDIPVGGAIQVDEASPLSSMLERYLPLELSLRFPEWEFVAFDAVYYLKTEKISEAGGRFLGNCLLLDDGTLIPFLLDLFLNPTGDSVTTLRLRVGEKGRGKLGAPRQWLGTKAAWKFNENLPYRLDSIHWAYVIDTDSED